MSTATEVLPEVQTGISDPDEFRHIVRTKEILTGGPIVALCGKKWIPVKTGASVMDLPLCGTCEDLFEFVKEMDS